jgi:hypothetical protein
MTPRQPIGFSSDVRCQFQLKHHWLGKNEMQQTICRPFSSCEEGFFCYYHTEDTERTEAEKKKISLWPPCPLCEKKINL